MRRKQKIPCRGHNTGCGNLVDPATKQHDGGYCPDCKAKAAKQYDQHFRDHNSAALYNSTRWRKARVSYLIRNPLCVVCKQKGRDEPARHVDHIIPHNGNAAMFWNIKNWQGLCAMHHSRKTAKEDGGFGNK